MAIDEAKPKEETITEPQTGEKPVIKIEPPQQTYEQEKKIVQRKRLVWYILLVLEVILIFRFLLKLFGADLSVFTILIMVVSTPFVILFQGLFPSSDSPNSNVSIEWSTLFAMVVYFVIAWLITVYYRFRKPVDPKEAEEKSKQAIP